MKYFRWPPDFINTMTWDNFTLFMKSIPDFDSDDNKEPELKSMNIEDWS
ncbi:hypothetical protein SNE25_20960 [Mucilaginibacter sabulilitoris]|uniref:Uncharacterized protein n=1 Tax=Mucilaginibacter sabulilitoris TaxID=1173583 RepID=A0ABZ0TGU5_9SPHI|nr:hypothetical protein [Mucilaginibacter sabulilitoris]WPU91791.1 hypothetical protein SNE25_20960 [Mucilaginibacter sabulilitoris]